MANQDPNSLITYNYDIGQDDWGDTMNDNMERLGIIGFHNAINGFVGSLPGSPSVGDKYIVTGSPNIRYWNGADWLPYTPREGWRVWDGDGKMLYIYNSGSWVENQAADPAYDASGDNYITTASETIAPALKELDGNVHTAVIGKKNYHGVEAVGAMTFNDSTHVLSVASITYWYQGVEYTSATPVTCDLDSYVTLTANTLYYVYFDDASGTLKASTGSWNLFTKVPVALVTWNGSAGAVGYECHGHDRDPAWHTNAHLTIGARYYSGLAQTLPSTATDNQISISGGTIYDEDIANNISAQTQARLWYKTATAYTFETTPVTVPYKLNGSLLQYLDTDTNTLTDVGANDYCVYWVYASNDISVPIYIFVGEASAPYNLVADARSATPPALSGLDITPELKLLYRWIFKGDGQYQEGLDYRTSSSLPSGGTAATAAASVSFTPSGDISSTNVQSAIEELDSEKVAKVTSVDDNIPTFNGTGGVLQDSGFAITDLMTKDEYALLVGTLSAPLFQAPLKNGLGLVHGAGSLTFSRTTTATYVDRYGVLQSAAIDEPRFEKEGILIEGESTNKCLYSQTLGTGWSATNSTVSSDSVSAPDGTTTADTVSGDGVSGLHYIIQTISGITAAAKTTLSAFVKKKDNSEILVAASKAGATDYSSVVFNLDTGAFTSISEWEEASVETLSDGWYRLKLTHTLTTGQTSTQIRIYSNNATSDASTTGTYYWGVQLEELPFASSYIPTTTTAVTRSGDVFTMPAPENVPDLATDNPECTILMDIHIKDIAQTNRYAWNYYTSASDQVYLLIETTDTIELRASGDGITTRVDLDFTPYENQTTRVGCVLDSTTNYIYINGILSESLSRGGGSPVDTNKSTLHIGQSSSNSLQLFGHISNFRIYDKALTASQVRVA